MSKRQHISKGQHVNKGIMALGRAAHRPREIYLCICVKYTTPLIRQWRIDWTTGILIGSLSFDSSRNGLARTTAEIDSGTC